MQHSSGGSQSMLPMHAPPPPAPVVTPEVAEVVAPVVADVVDEVVPPVVDAELAPVVAVLVVVELLEPPDPPSSEQATAVTRTDERKSGIDRVMPAIAAGCHGSGNTDRERACLASVRPRPYRSVVGGWG